MSVNRSARFTIRMTPAQNAAFRAAARLEGITSAEAGRRAFAHYAEAMLRSKNDEAPAGDGRRVEAPTEFQVERPEHAPA